MEILVIHPGALGDIILSLPALRILRDQFNRSRITLAANTEFAEAVASACVAKFLPFSHLPLHRLYLSEPIPLGDRKFWNSYGKILSWTGARESSFAARLARIHPCSLVAPWKPEGAEPRHVARIFADSLRPWLSPPSVLPPSGIAVGPAALAQGAEWLRSWGLTENQPLYILHPGAGSAVKRWPLPRFEDLAHRLSARGELVIVEGPADEGLGRDLVRAVGRRSHLADQLPLPVLAAVMSMSRAFVGNDSGVAHLAAGLQIPCVVIFGPTPPEHWAPLGPYVSVLRDPRDCGACRHDPGARHRCLENISVDAVWQRLDRV